VVTTSRTATAYVEFTAQCTQPDGSPTHQRAGQARVTLLPRQGDSFTFDIAQNLIPPATPFPWQGTVSGIVGANGGTLDMRVTGSAEGDTCDTGQLSLTLRRTR
jgi:hypothetical protein